MDLSSLFGGGGGSSFGYSPDWGGSYSPLNSGNVFGGGGNNSLMNMGIGGGSQGISPDAWSSGGSFGSTSMANAFGMPSATSMQNNSMPSGQGGYSPNTGYAMGMPKMGMGNSTGNNAGGMSTTQNPMLDNLKFQGGLQSQGGLNGLSTVDPFMQKLNVMENSSNTSNNEAQKKMGWGKAMLPGMGAGLGMMGLSNLIGNAQAPKMPKDFNEYMSMMKGGGTPGMQAAQNWYKGVLNNTDSPAYNAATRFIDLQYQQNLRDLNAQYHSLRPGSDPSSDATYQRDLANLQTSYQQQKADALAKVQQGAAQGAAGVGAEQMGGLQGGIGQQLSRQGSAWGNKQGQIVTARNAGMGLGAQQAAMPMNSQQMEMMMRMMPSLMNMFNGGGNINNGGIDFGKFW